MEKKVYSFLHQAFIFAAIMLISKGIAFILPIPMPASVIGLILLFVALSTNIVKLEQVEGLGTSLTGIISFLFVPSGISLYNSLDILKVYGVPILAVIFIATFVILAITGWSASYLLGVKEKSGAKERKLAFLKKQQLEEVQR